MPDRRTPCLMTWSVRSSPVSGSRRRAALTGAEEAAVRVDAPVSLSRRTREGDAIWVECGTGCRQLPGVIHRPCVGVPRGVGMGESGPTAPDSLTPRRRGPDSRVLDPRGAARVRRAGGPGQPARARPGGPRPRGRRPGDLVRAQQRRGARHAARRAQGGPGRRAAGLPLHRRRDALRDRRQRRGRRARRPGAGRARRRRPRPSCPPCARWWCSASPEWHALLDRTRHTAAAARTAPAAR